VVIHTGLGKYSSVVLTSVVNILFASEAKEAAKKIVTGQLKASATTSFNDARKLSTEIALISWQR